MSRQRHISTQPWPPNATPRIAPRMTSPNAFAPKSRFICVTPHKRTDASAMEIKSHLADRFVASPPPCLVAALVYGPDQGMVRERAGRLARNVVPDLNDP